MSGLIVFVSFGPLFFFFQTVAIVTLDGGGDDTTAPDLISDSRTMKRVLLSTPPREWMLNVIVFYLLHSFSGSLSD